MKEYNKTQIVFCDELLNSIRVERWNKTNLRYIRRRRGYRYYFDSNGIYHKEKDPTYTSVSTCYVESIDETGKLMDLDGVRIAMAVKLLNHGDTIMDFVNIYNRVYAGMYSDNTAFGIIDRIIGKIERPMFERMPENPNKKTFDRIRLSVGVCLTLYTRKEAMQLIKENIEEANLRVVEYLQNNKSFIKYGVPISFLKIASITFTRDSRLEYIFELKEV
jgi:hypothetical protein